MESNLPVKKIKLDTKICNENSKLHYDQYSLKKFMKWAMSSKVILSNKVDVVKDGVAHRFGMIALAKIEPNEVIVSIPRTILFTENINPQVKASNNLNSRSGWVKLVLSMMFEYTKPDSQWKEYFDFFPTKDELDLPMFWDHQVRTKLLQGTHLLDNVNEDIKHIEEEYNTIALPFIKENEKYGFSPMQHCIELYKQMVAIIMAYSFTEEIETISPPFLVPMADVFNHISKNNAQLNFGASELKMVACRSIEPGEEIFNSYGQLSNWQLLQMYGFTEKPEYNIYDFIDIKISEFKEAALAQHKKDNVFPEIDKKLNFLFGNEGLLSNTECLAFGKYGILSYEPLKLLFKVLTMSSESFKDFDPDWMSDDSESESDNEDDFNEFDCLSYKKVKQKYDKNWLAVLQIVCNTKYAKLSEHLSNLKSMKLNEKSCKQSRINNVITLVCSLLNILHNLTSNENNEINLSKLTN